ncbi:spore wall synthesis complex protein [Nocardioides hungaricus]
MLSEEELRLLEQMERALVEEDPKLASTLRGTAFRRSARRRAIIAGVCFVLGVVVLMAGAVAQQPIVGVVGFVVMLVSATVALTSLRSQQAAAADPRAAHPSHGFTVIDGGRSGKTRRPRRTSGHSFMERMEERWRHRREDGGF